VKIDLLRAARFRCFEEVAFAPGPGLNWLIGPNGSGKTTLLEAAYLLSRGRSFRAGGRAAPGRHGQTDFLVYAEIERKDRPKTRVGLTRKDDHWVARRNGESLANLGPLFEACPVVYFGPEDQSLIMGASENRRAFLDWSVFHVEHNSLDLWRSWRRALRQRNALLRRGAPDDHFPPWEHDLADLANRIHAMRIRCLQGLTPYLSVEASVLVPELGGVRVDYRPGWDERMGLGEQLARTRARDRERGFTRYGAHRADWSLVFERVAQREHLSRGQAKAAALVCILALTRWLKDSIGEYPLLCLDDLESELDSDHLGTVVRWLSQRSIQSWLTSTRSPDSTLGLDRALMFHVEQSGCVPIPLS
jgi:DNA replication and repair protein RecF